VWRKSSERYSLENMENNGIENSLELEEYFGAHHPDRENEQGIV